MSSLYALRHPETIEKLILLSPVGLSSKYSEIKSTRMEDWLQSMCFKLEKSPSFVFKIMGGFISNTIFNYVCTEEKFRGLKKKVSNIFLNYLFSLFRKNFRLIKIYWIYYLGTILALRRPYLLFLIKIFKLINQSLCIRSI